MQIGLNSHGHIIGTDYVSDLVEKEHKHGNCLGANIFSGLKDIYHVV
jgi:hypothetical protein